MLQQQTQYDLIYWQTRGSSNRAWARICAKVDLLSIPEAPKLVREVLKLEPVKRKVHFSRFQTKKFDTNSRMPQAKQSKEAKFVEIGDQQK